MATINFYGINNTRSKNPDELNIYCYVREHGKTLTLNTEEKINSKYWDVKKQRAKKGFTGSPEFNEYLQRFEDKIKKIIRIVRIEDVNASFDNVKSAIEKEFKRKNSNQFFDVLAAFIESYSKLHSKSTVKKYISLRNHLIEFEKVTQNRISLELINNKFFNELTDYFLSINHTNNHILKNLENLKTFLRWSVSNDYTQNIKFEKFEFSIKSTTPEEIALTREELSLIINYNGLNERLEKVRDLFLFQLYVGQRFSDIERFDIRDVKNSIWTIKQGKTGKKLDIPLIEPALNILHKYNNTLPIISNQKMNEYLKELGKIVGINETEVITKQVGSKKIEKRYFRYELLKTHTARRTFVSLASYHNLDKNVVKSVTGHGSDKMVATYFKKNLDENRRLMEDVFQN